MAIQQGDIKMQAMALMNGHNQHMMMQNQQQQMMQQQMYATTDDATTDASKGVGSAIAGFGSSLIRGSLGYHLSNNNQ